MRTLDFTRPLIMGILNVTPDSFSDGGGFATLNSAVAHATQMIADGADIIDIGGESSRPGAQPVSLVEELQRVIPVVQALRTGSKICISVDTTKAEVARQALAAGADMINDISAGRFDTDMLSVVAEAKRWYCVMHMQGTPQDMQISPTYSNVVSEVYEFLSARIDACVNAGIARSKIIIDPGIGFGKRLEDNLDLLSRLEHFRALACPLLIGVSRKKFIESLSGGAVPPKERLAGSLSAALVALTKGANIVRVHDVRETAQAIAVYAAIRSFDDRRNTEL